MDTLDRQPVWTVLLIGGNSGAGKTTVARLIAGRYGVACSQVDDFRLMLQRAVPVEQNRVLHFFTANKEVWQHSPERLCEALVEVGRFVSWSLEIVIASHVATGVPIVLEGDGITPELAARNPFLWVWRQVPRCARFSYVKTTRRRFSQV